MIDCDIHINPSDLDEFLARVEPAQREWFRGQGPTLGLPGYPWSHPTGWFRQDAEPGPRDLAGSSLEAVQHEVLDRFEVDIGLLNADGGVVASLMPSPYRAAAYTRAHNDWMRECWLDRDPRLRGSIICPAQDPATAAAEIRRCAEDERFVCVLLVGGSERPYGEPRYLPIFEAAVECGLPVAIHSGGEGMGLASAPTGAGLPTFYIEWHTVGSASSIMAHLVSLVCNGVFERLPDLRVLMIEGGLAWVPGLLWRLDTNWRALRSEVPWLERRPSEVVRHQVRFSTQPLEHTDGRDELLFELLELIGAPQTLCFASDYPHWDGDDPSHMLERLPQEWREPVMHANAARLFGSRLGLEVAG